MENIKRSTKRYTQQEFIDKAKSIHGDKYDYSKVKYVNNKTKITVICSKHGEFTIRPFNHIIAGDGCSACRYEAKYDLEYYVNKLKERYPDIIVSEKQDLKEKVKIRKLDTILLTCPKHGDYKIKFNWLIRNPNAGKGHLATQCPDCLRNKRIERHKQKLEEKINSRDLKQEVRDHFGDKYQLLNPKYKNARMKLSLRCPKHGIFIVNLPNLLKSEGCPGCVSDAKFEELVKRAKELHGDKYEYRKGGYRGKSYDLIHLICPKHGSQPTRVKTILNGGGGCVKCFLEDKGSKFLKYDNDSVLERVKVIHGDKYDYSLFDYKGSEIKVKLGCPVHGIFEITPHSLLKGHGCVKCGREVHRDKTRYTLEEVADKGRLIHANKYKYISLSYVPMRRSDGVKNIGVLKYICPDCGKLNEQRVSNHLKGYGCKRCYESNGEKRIEQFLIKNKVRFQREAVIKNTGYRIDFYLIDLKIGIEYHGIQHYKDFQYFSSSSNLADRQKNDVKKLLLFEKYGSTIISVKYTVYNIEEFITNALRHYFQYYKDGYVFKTYYDLAKYNKFNKENFAQDYDKYLILNMKAFPFTAKSVNEFPLIAGTPLEPDGTKDI